MNLSEFHNMNIGSYEHVVPGDLHILDGRFSRFARFVVVRRLVRIIVVIVMVMYALVQISARCTNENHSSRIRTRPKRVRHDRPEHLI